mmetsp:Transcript_81753/g.221499  ORF Transcript_81753/g.221499 Transcript_81753/m.221499 type:complete len:97 (+) Transcript_81753:212-502(+)
MTDITAISARTGWQRQMEADFAFFLVVVVVVVVVVVGHAFVLHSPDSVVDPSQGLPPPLAGDFSVLVRCLVPPPQDFEHLPHDPYSPHAQSTGLLM